MQSDSPKFAGSGGRILNEIEWAALKAWLRLNDTRIRHLDASEICWAAYESRQIPNKSGLTACPIRDLNTNNRRRGLPTGRRCACHPWPKIGSRRRMA